MGLRIFVGIVVLVVAAAVVYGFILVGSPGSQRVLKFDERRVSDLQNISFAIDSYWERNEQLPENLGDLQRQNTSVRSFVDPETRQPYEYHILSVTIYELCAMFNAPTPTEGIEYFPGYPWGHEAGRACFEREVQKPMNPADPGLIRPEPIR